MPDTDRLAELRRQRARIEDHLAWLDREIAAEEKALGVTGAPAEAPRAAATTAEVSAAGTAHDTDAMLEEYRAPAEDLKKDVRNGCLFYFAAALVALAAIVAVLYYVARR